MKYFKTTLPLAETRSYIKALKAYDYEYCILSMKDNTSVVISNSHQLTGQLSTASADFEPMKIHTREMEAIRLNQVHQTAVGNFGLVLVS